MWNPSERLKPYRILTPLSLDGKTAVHYRKFMLKPGIGAPKVGTGGGGPIVFGSGTSGGSGRSGLR
jgi:hypothetical protein